MGGPGGDGNNADGWKETRAEGITETRKKENPPNKPTHLSPPPPPPQATGIFSTLPNFSPQLPPPVPSSSAFARVSGSPPCFPAPSPLQLILYLSLLFYYPSLPPYLIPTHPSTT